MSLILDALRKSEAERRKAQVAGDVLAAAPRADATPLAGAPAWLWPAAAAAALALVGWLWLGRTPITGVRPQTPEATATVNAVDDTAVEQVQDAETMPAPPATTASATLAGATPAPIALDTRAQSAATMPAIQPMTAPTAAAAPTAMVSPTGETAGPSRTAVTAATTAIPTATAAPPRNPAESGAPPPQLLPATRAPSVPSSVPAAASIGAGSGTLRLADLGIADRQQLPPLKMSMHMWGPDAGKRFAIIDGTRVGEGDRVGETVVESIDQDGVVLAWNGQRLRVPVR